MLNYRHRKYLLLSVFFVLSLNTLAQYNPYVSLGSVSPAPLPPVEENGTGILSFTTGNSGEEPIPLSDSEDSRIVIRIALENGTPDGDPIASLGGSAAGYYTWTYENGVYTGVQNAVIEAASEGSVSIAYRVTQNSSEDSPGNGFHIQIYPGIYISGNIITDDQLSAFTWTWCAAPPAPLAGTITQPTCAVSTGTIELLGLPATGSWTLLRTPGNIEITGTGSSVAMPDIAPGTYRFMVTNSQGCASALSEPVVINAQPSIPPVPTYQIVCGPLFVAMIVVTSPTGAGYTYRLDDGEFTSSQTFLSVNSGNHTISVRNSAGCITTTDEFAVACGCLNRPSVTLSSRTGTTCGTTPVTIQGNTFSNATLVTITQDGTGTVSPQTINASPFAFTYTPSVNDAGRVVTITLTTNNPLGGPCEPAATTYSLTVNELPAAPVPGNITHPTCALSTGSISLSGFPATGIWSLVRTPGNVTIQGSGTTTTVTGLESGTYRFTVVYHGCNSEPSQPVTVEPQPHIPSAPVLAGVIHPTCTETTGTINLSGLPATGSWTITRYPGTVITTGSGTSESITGLAPGTYNFTVTSESGCTSALSSNIIVNMLPLIPSAPVAGAVTAPTCTQPGSVVLNGLPTGGRWTVENEAGDITLSGDGRSVTVRGLTPGSYQFKVTNSAGCTSEPGEIIVIPAVPGAPVLNITDPLPVCAPATVDLTDPGITSGSTPGLTLTYWTNSAGTTALTTPEAAIAGTYYIRAINEANCSDIKRVNVSVLSSPLANAGPDQELNYVFTSEAEASLPGPGETGSWTVYRGNGVFADISDPRTVISQLEPGENIFIWRVTNGVCPEVTDTLKIAVKDLIVPTLITPNEDGINDYFILSGIEQQPGSELTIFDRRGVVVFRDADYANNWNGVDYNGRPLADDTYFYVLRTAEGRHRTGFIVVRR